MKNSIKRFLSIIVVLFITMLIAGCDMIGGMPTGKQQLAVPTNVEVSVLEEIVVTWDSVENAETYSVFFYYQGACIKSVDAESGLVVDFLEPGTYEVGVRAYGDLQLYNPSKMSRLVKFSVEVEEEVPTPGEIQLVAPSGVATQYNAEKDEVTVTFRDHEDFVNATSYQCYFAVGSEYEKIVTITKSGATVDVSDLSNGTYNVYIKAITNKAGFVSSNISTSYGQFTIERVEDTPGDVTLSGYYAAANGKVGDALEQALTTIITSTHKKTTTYNSLNNYLQDYDEDLANANNIILFYTHSSIKSTWDGGTSYNKEHVWPQSQNCDKGSTQGSDGHHVRPCDPNVNSTRSNYGFNNCPGGSPVYSKLGVLGGYRSGKYFEPLDHTKGDAARIIMYMLVRYPFLYSNLSNVMSIKVMLEWNELDPVDKWEANRNEEVYKVQGNRNPFIDHPELAELIWG